MVSHSRSSTDHYILARNLPENDSPDRGISHARTSIVAARCGVFLVSHWADSGMESLLNYSVTLKTRPKKHVRTRKIAHHVQVPEFDFGAVFFQYQDNRTTEMAFLERCRAAFSTI